MDEILKCGHSNGSYCVVLFCGAVYYAAQGGSNFWVSGWNPKVWPFKWKLLSSTLMRYSLFVCLQNETTFLVNLGTPKSEAKKQTSKPHCLLTEIDQDFDYWGTRTSPPAFPWNPLKAQIRGDFWSETRKKKLYNPLFIVMWNSNYHNSESMCVVTPTLSGHPGGMLHCLLEEATSRGFCCFRSILC